MILPDFQILSRINQHWEYSGIDSFQNCRNKNHFLNFPYKINYDYNSRGFRDQEWPNDITDLKNSIWCIGDSFTVGIGSPWSHTWPQRLQWFKKQRTINVSMDGASNCWISKKACKVIEEINPKTIIVQWSYISRRELDLDKYFDQQWNRFYDIIRDKQWPECTRQERLNLPVEILEEIDQVHGGWKEIVPSDETRIIWATPDSPQEDLNHTLSCIQTTQNLANKNGTTLIHSFIPQFVPTQLKGMVESQIQGLVIPEIVYRDLARDGHHYDILTSDHLVKEILQYLS